MALKTFWVHLSDKFCLLSSNRRGSASRPAYSRIWHFLWGLSTPIIRIQANWVEHASKSALHCLHQPPLTLAQAWGYFSTGRWRDVFLSLCLMMTEGNQLLHAHPGHIFMQSNNHLAQLNACATRVSAVCGIHFAAEVLKEAFLYPLKFNSSGVGLLDVPASVPTALIVRAFPTCVQTADCSSRLFYL
jgi:hypothetical protein